MARWRPSAQPMTQRRPRTPAATTWRSLRGVGTVPAARSVAVRLELALSWTASRSQLAQNARCDEEGRSSGGSLAQLAAQAGQHPDSRA